VSKRTPIKHLLLEYEHFQDFHSTHIFDHRIVFIERNLRHGRIVRNTITARHNLNHLTDYYPHDQRAHQMAGDQVSRRKA
jgi:hypothetical protein